MLITIIYVSPLSKETDIYPLFRQGLSHGRLCVSGWSTGVLWSTTVQANAGTNTVVRCQKTDRRIITCFQRVAVVDDLGECVGPRSIGRVLRIFYAHCEVLKTFELGCWESDQRWLSVNCDKMGGVFIRMKPLGPPGSRHKTSPLQGPGSSWIWWAQKDTETQALWWRLDPDLLESEKGSGRFEGYSGECRVFWGGSGLRSGLVPDCQGPPASPPTKPPESLFPGLGIGPPSRASFASAVLPRLSITCAQPIRTQRLGDSPDG